MPLDFLNAVKSPVYYKMGKHKNEQRDRFVKAPFDLLKLGGVTYVSPVGISGNHAKEFAGLLDGTITADSEAGYQNRLSDNGWVDEMVTVEPHEMGDRKDDNWKSVHQFGLL